MKVYFRVALQQTGNLNGLPVYTVYRDGVELGRVVKRSSVKMHHPLRANTTTYHWSILEADGSWHGIYDRRTDAVEAIVRRNKPEVK